ncbi:MAG TPA: phosphodiester glycosidase family protein [Gaiellaceae bacterium]|nr:phosphodiester glycosidase family protein [Gaiellaceae bacterium]
MLRRAAILFVLTAAFASPAAAQPTELMPGVTYERTVTFTPHGVVVLHVITAPRPGGLYALQPVLAGGTLTGGLAPVTRLQRDLAATATTAGIEGDFFRAADSRPSGIWISNGLVVQPPLASRSSIGIDASGMLRVQRERLFGTWQGTGQRRTLTGLNEPPGPGQTVLFTSAYGARTPPVTGAAEVVLDVFPATAPNTDLAATVAAGASGGGEPIPAGGAVLMATGAAAEKLRAEAPVGTTLRSRLGLQPAWDGVTAAFGGGPALVRNGKAVFRSLEDFTNDQVGSRTARAAVGQRADGRIVLVAVDGGRPGYSVGLTSFELARALVGLGVVTAAGVDPGDSVTAAFDGRLLNRPSGRAERAVKEALLVEYFGVFAPEPPLPLLTGEPGLTTEPVSYKVVRASTVTATLVGPDGTPHPVETGVAHVPGTYAFTAATFDREGTWRWDVAASDDLGRTSTIERTFRYDTTLQGLVVPRTARRTLRVGFTLDRPAQVTLRIETAGGVLVRALPSVALQPGARSVAWDGRLPRGSLAFAGMYVAHLLYTSDSGASERSESFRFRR